MRRLRLLAVLVAILALTLPTRPTTNPSLGTRTASAAGAPTVTLHGSTTTVRPDLATPADGATACTATACTMALTAAKNEFESFQITIQPPADSGINNIRVNLGTPLTNAGFVLNQSDASGYTPNTTIYR